MIHSTTNTLYQYRTVRPSFSTSHPPRLGAFDLSSHRRSTTGTANCIVSPALLLSCMLLSTKQTNPPIPCPHAWTRAAYDGLRPKTYPPQRYLERADLTISCIQCEHSFNHNISMRPLGQHCHNLQISCSPRRISTALASRFAVFKLAEGATPFRCHSVLDGREGHEVAWNSITKASRGRNLHMETQKCDG